EWKTWLINDFDEPIAHHHPEIADCKKKLYEQGAIYTSMTGSGSTVYGIFQKDRTPSLSFPPHYFVKII
ncbi:MAG TPA: 4-(cytidine 5'-diphospho)-2-C-methyl-D-erythritol kinase, partial [Flavisolibacter sp.]